MSGKSDAATTTEDIKMAPLCLFYFSHPFGILSPNPPSVTMAPEDYLPPSWMSTAFSEKSWIPINFPIKKIDISSTTERDDTPEEHVKSKQYPIHRKYTEENEPTKKYTKTVQRQKREKLNNIDIKKQSFESLKNSKLNIHRPTTNFGLLPPIERIEKVNKNVDLVKSWPNSEGINKFRRKSLLPPIDMRCLQLRKESASESSRCESKNNQEDLSDLNDEPVPKKVKVKRKLKSARRIRPIRSSRGVNKGRCLPNRSAARKLVACLLQNASKGRRATTASLPSLSEVLNTVRQAWASPKSLLPETKGEILDLRPCKEAKSTNMGLGQPLLPGASPGLLRRRYSLPETVMRKYKLAQQKSDSEDSETGSAPSTWVPIHVRERGSRGRERGPKSVLLRRLWGREPPPIGGSHSELRYWDSRSGSSSPRSPDRTCEACKRLSDKSISTVGKSETYKTFLNRSPKKQPFKCLNSANHSPERYAVENGKSTSTLLANSTTSERSSFKSVSVTDGSPKLGLSSLVTSSYPATETISASDMTRSSASYSSDETSRSQSNPILMRPSTGKSSPLHKKRRQSASSYTTSEFDTKDSLQTTSDTSNKTTPQGYTSARDTTTSETTTTTTTTTFTTTDTKKETSSSRTDSAMSTHTENSTDYNKTTDNISSTDTPSTPCSENKHDTQNNTKHSIHHTVELSDTGISDTFECDSGKTTESLNDGNNSKEGSVTFSEDYSADIVTCVEKHIENPSFECLEVVISETLNSSAFDNKNLIKKEITSDSNKNDHMESECSSRNTNRLDIDQYVSNILIDSLNTMTDQINEINSNIDDDRKLNILEKEIKVKLQSVSASPINIITNPIITTLITSIPDKELLETTVIEEKMRSLAYTTESKLFSMESTVEIETRALAKSLEVPLEGECDSNEGNVNLADSEAKEMSQTNNNCYDEGNEPGLYLNTDTPLPYDVNENESGISAPFEDEKTKAVLRQLHRMFENNSKNSLEALRTNVDDNFNLCDDDAPKTYFCGTINDNNSHLEMSTDVDVFVDNSLNKMMNSIDINYNNGEVDENRSEKDDILVGNLNGNKDPVLEKLNIPELRLKENSNMLSNIGTGSAYEKPPRRPLVVPRFSAIPHSESMEVNTSTDDEALDCQSDCMSLVDSLDDPNSPRFIFANEQKAIKKGNNHDKKLVRGDIMTLLPENASVVTENKSPREKSEKFFIPIKENSMEVLKENIVVAEHMPEKIREKLILRQQKRELRKEHYKRKRLKQLKKELHRQKKIESDKVEINEKEQTENKSSPEDQITTSEKSDSKKKIESSKLKTNGETDKKDKPISSTKKSSVKSERAMKKEETLKNIEAFIIDKQGNFQSKKPATKKASDKKERPLRTQNMNDKIEDIKLDDAYLYRKNDANNSVEAVESIKVLKSKVDVKNERSSGPRRLYQKTEFQEGNKHVEILEIVECVESSPEPSDESQESFSSDGKKQNGSKIPVLQKKTIQKSNRGSRSPIGKNIPMNITAAKSDRDHYKSTNSKTDQLIASILIDAFNKDDLENSNVQLVASPRDKKSTSNQIKSPQVINRRMSMPQQNTASATAPKYRRKFEAIPEEKSSMSVESSNEDVSMNISNARRSSVPLEAKRTQVKMIESPKSSPKKTKPLKTIDENVKENSPKKSVPSKNQDVSTSPIPRYASAATSPIPLSKLDEALSKNHDPSNHIKGKKALGTREGWAGFCRPQTRYSPENEGLHPSSNNPSDREVVGKIEIEKTQLKKAVVAPPSQKTLRTKDVRDNISPHQDSPKSSDNQKSAHKANKEKHSSKKHRREKVANGNENDSELKSADIKSEENGHNKSLTLPSPFKNQSFTQSSDMSTSSGSDSEAGVNCPVLVPRWPPINAPRYRRTYPRRQQRQDESFKMPYQNISGGWSVTLAGSCYTTLPSDVEMKVCFPKNAPQHTTSQSDSGLGEEQHYRKQSSNAPTMCKKCSNCDNLICQNCKSAQSCKCNTIVDKNQTENNIDSENQIFLPPAHQIRKNSKLETDAAVNQKDTPNKYYHYLPDLNTTHGLKNKKKATMKMARRFSLHCWLPEDKLTERADLAKLEITETIAPINYDELSVYGSAIMPEIKPRVPTMSERDLTRVHTAQHYSRHRHI